ncbi:Rieske 2Fe-2S domain-containing protein [Bordetella hinzii]|uniref:Phthalate 4,5-dioxygenase oxygenase subunit family protein n=1 Tax=Bordetella hinzii OH87 BAL007II TaxID=1331262 RepID=A0ABR4R0C7_9BORD|nr:Rieske 2Fe-2S domain-containing protein [Bordetella hinzii]KCB24058.1 phthalate 4,5-dioxygenase oxygenase subunit family protein [Bordetella hinzii OH87 BAL007II]KCB28155.1 phthalate 4,5-dioxygenase oxygenase subunit family protein [Bordetella hinzii CA90 BAL1384]KCB45821.1 phthalate 4,5-dioxygenase oxygenase subunit family protein [Bordetella hinzii 5132]QDJ32405.1 MarR family transcriptional regulator [Bordetella hinzii]QDJ41533.1 MarR family transcriptional regulator [Bordetella hinzii]
MLTKEENELLCRVEGDAAMGQLMRRHWVPVCLTEEVSEPDGDPVHARILGEDLVVFRDTEGRVGVMDEYCPHRRVSLVYGRNEDCGLRCLYHGWKMDVEGTVIEMVSEPAASSMAEKVKHKAYKVQEWGGMVWAFMGPQDQVPEFVPPSWAPERDTKVSIAKVLVPCNWAQILEGAIDSAHSSSLHSSDFVPARVGGAEATDKNWLRPSTDKAPRMQVHRTPYGFRYAAIRRPITNAAQNDYIRSTVFVAPGTVLIPPNNLYNVANVNVPMDDTNTVFYFIAWGARETTPDTETWRKFLGASVGRDLDERYRPLRNMENRFWQDRQAMKAGNFTGIKGFPNQDIAMWVTMGPIANRSDDRLGASDLAIVEFRRQMLEAVQAFAQGAPAIGTAEQRIPASVCAFQAIVPKSVDWREFQAAPVGREAGADPELETNYQTTA